MNTSKILWFIGLVLVTAICLAAANYYHPSGWFALPAIFLGMFGVLFLATILLTPHSLHKEVQVELGERISFLKVARLLLRPFLMAFLAMCLFIYFCLPSPNTFLFYLIMLGITISTVIFLGISIASSLDRNAKMGFWKHLTWVLRNMLPISLLMLGLSLISAAVLIYGPRNVWLGGIWGSIGAIQICLYQSLRLRPKKAQKQTS